MDLYRGRFVIYRETGLGFEMNILDFEAEDVKEEEEEGLNFELEVSVCLAPPCVRQQLPPPPPPPPPLFIATEKKNNG